MKQLLVFSLLISLSSAASLGCKNMNDMFKISDSYGSSRKSITNNLIESGKCAILYVDKSDIKSTNPPGNKSIIYDS